ncbi:UbiA family prenyltransferase [Nocardia sp. NPDC057227]|uniref:UbiA family prenyltransferase n=1 Tax=Nocardia sp. NPDC057227 TaxID=3346056 RepID=UPI00362F347D
MTTFADFLAMPVAQRVTLVRESTGEQRLSWPLRARLYVAFSRPRTCVPMIFAFQLGAEFTGIEQTWRTAIGLAVFFVVGAIANLFNIYTDIEEDSANMPARVFHLSRYGRKRLLRDTYVLCALVVAAAACVSPAFLLTSIVALIGAHQYSCRPLRLKERPVLGILMFATVIAYPFAGIAALAPDIGVRALDSALLFASLYLLLWFCAKGLVKNVPDFEGDAGARLSTSATVTGSRDRAARTAAVASIIAYAGIAVPVALEAFPPRALFTLLWLPIVIWQGIRLIRADTMTAGNNVLRTDMLVSAGFLASLILLLDCTAANVTVVLVGMALIAIADALRLDTRTKQDSVR